MKKINPKKIIDKFIEQFKRQHREDNINIEGVILFGSFLNPKKINKNSDLDLYLIIKNNGMRYRGIKYIDNIEIDYFANPIEQIKNEINSAGNSKKTLMHLLAEGKILLDRNEKLSKLKKDAKRYLEEERSASVPDFQATFMKYFINDYLNDIEDSYLQNNNFSLQYNTDLLLNYLIEVFCKYNHIVLTKPKHQKQGIMKKSPIFVELYEKIIAADNKEKKMMAVAKLSDYVLQSLGGKLPKEWEIKSRINP